MFILQRRPQRGWVTFPQTHSSVLTRQLRRWEITLLPHPVWLYCSWYEALPGTVSLNVAHLSSRFCLVSGGHYSWASVATMGHELPARSPSCCPRAFALRGELTGWGACLVCASGQEPCGKPVLTSQRSALNPPRGLAITVSGMGNSLTSS